MAKTINPNVEIFATIQGARKVFDKKDSPCDLLFHGGNYFVDTTKEHEEKCIISWPNLYTLVDRK